MSENFIKITGAILITAFLIIAAPIPGKPINGGSIYFGFVLGQMIPPIVLGGIVSAITFKIKKDKAASAFSISCIALSVISIIGQTT